MQEDFSSNEVQETPAAPQATGSELNRNTPPQSDTTPASPKSGKRKSIIFITIILLVVALSAGGYFIWAAQDAARQEELAYAVLENNDNPQDYRDFLEKYPESKYMPEVKQRLARLETMLQQWGMIALSDNVNDFVNFKRNYTDAQYGRLCDIKIDSLDFIAAQRDGSQEAYARYLDAHPDGRYASEASIAQGTLRDQEVTLEDRGQIIMVINDFFEGFGSLDENKVYSNIAATMDTFLNLKNADKVAVMKTIRGMFNEHIQGCQFVVNRDIQVTGQDRNGSKVYVATFTVDQHIERDNEGKTYGLYKCTAEVSPQLLITSLTMQEISQQ